MAITLTRQETEVRNSDTYDDTVAPTEAAFETNPTNIEVDLSNIRSMLSYLKDIQAGNWWDVLVTPSTFEGGAQRAVDNLNQDLHDLERKRVLRDVHNLTDVTVGGSDNFVILGTGELPANTTAAVGAVTTLGTVVAFHGGTFGTHALSEVAGPSAIAPDNLQIIVDGATRDPILSADRQIYGLFQTETAADGHTITITTTTRVQISFVRINAAGNDLEACPAADIQGKIINYCSRERVAFEDLNEADFLRGAIVDPGGSTTTTRQAAYDNQGTTVVEVTTNSTLDLNSAGVFWKLRDLVNADLLTLTEGSTGGTTVLQIGADVDTFDNNAIVNDFASGTTINSGGTRPITVGVTDGVISSTAGDLQATAAAELLFDDGNRGGSTFSTAIKLTETTAEWSDFETAFGEVSILAAITAADSSDRGTKTTANVTSTTTADTDIGGVAGGANLDTQLPDLSVGIFLQHDVYVNGRMNEGGADATANNDYYPGTSLPNGQLKFEKTIKINDKITVVTWV